ncbi:MAG: hypothetical protein IJ583_11455 [Firmicutes bacterium]|nr:hypothetical protein [Bacillota bacterium]
MGLADIYGNQSKGYTVATAAFRFAVVAKVCGVSLTDEVNTLTGGDYKEVRGRPMTETLERLLLLYGAGIIDFTVVEDLLKIKSDISPVLAQAEEFIIEQSEYYEQIRMPIDRIKTIILCCAKSRIYADKNALSFDEARQICLLENVAIVNGFVKIPDYELLKILLENGELFGYLHDGRELYIEEKNDSILLDPDVQAGNVESGDYPFMINPGRIVYYDKILKLMYSAEFLQYCKKCGHAIDENIMSHYDRFLHNIKCSFTVNCCHRKRKICGDKVNQFDYFTNIKNDSIGYDKSEKIEVKPTEEKSNAELMKMALDEFCTKYPVEENTVLEVRNQGNIDLFVIREEKYIPVESEEFRRPLFDYDAIWGKIQEYATNHSIKVVNGTVEIPVELMQMFDEKDRVYAESIICEQYSRQSESKGGKVFTTLLKLMTDAAVEAKKTSELKQGQAKLKQEQEEKKSKRGTGVEE